MDTLSKELSEQKLRFGDVQAIILRASEIDSRLKYSRSFLKLCSEYGVEIKFDIESTNAFKFQLLPILDRRMKQIPEFAINSVNLDISDFLGACIRFYESLSDFEKVNINDYFSSVELENIDIEDFENKFSKAKKSYLQFLKSIERNIGIPLEYVLREKREDNQ